MRMLLQPGVNAGPVLAMVVIAGCSYGPGSFSYPGRTFAGRRASLGCLDLAVDRRADLPDGAAVVAYAFGNRCDRPVVVDLARVPVRGRTVTGDEVPLVPYDPDRELRARSLDARAAGGEALAYPSATRLAQICLDTAAIEAGRRPSHWLCFAEVSP